MMKTFVSICALISLCFVIASAQGKQKTVKAKPNFTGKWLLDRAKSNVGSSVSPEQPIKIVHHDPELRITHMANRDGQIVAVKVVYYTDGRGETNPATSFVSAGTDMDPQRHDKDVTKSKTTWSGNKLVTRSTLSNSTGGRLLEFEVIDEWKLSTDGKTLTQTSRTLFRPDTAGGIFVPANRPDSKRIYNRVPD
jgi:hypothetical protein